MNEQITPATKYQGYEGEDPTAPFWASGNYVGPYWSNGKVQSSVEWGERPAFHELDELARQHDAAYAHFKDEKHREAADEIFADGARKLKQKYGTKLADDPRMAAALVQFGNYAARKASKLPSYLSYGPLGIFKYGYDHVKEMNARIHGTHLKNEKTDVHRFFETDPTGSQIRVAKLANVSSEKPHTTGTNGGNPRGSANQPAPKPTAGNLTAIEVSPASLSAREAHNQDLIRSQHQRFKNYQALKQAAHKQPAHKILKNKKRVGTTFGYVHPTVAVPFSHVEQTMKKKNKKKNAVRPI